MSSENFNGNSETVRNSAIEKHDSDKLTLDRAPFANNTGSDGDMRNVNRGTIVSISPPDIASEGKHSHLWQVFIFFFVVLLLASSAACCLFSPSVPQLPKHKIANAKTAKDLLLSVANGAVLYSGQHGGNGKTNFPRKSSDFIETLPPSVAHALEGCTNTLIPSDGYLCRLIPLNTENNFLFEAYPADGYTGDSFIITRDFEVRKKDEQPAEDCKKVKKITAPAVPVTQSEPVDTPSVNVQTSVKMQPIKKNSTVSEWLTSARQKIKDTINPPPPPPPTIRPTKPGSATEMLQSVYHASKLYSAEHGGNGKAMFPTKPTQIANLVPPVIKKSIVFLYDEEDKAVPIDGYIMIMYPAKTQNPTDDFRFVAYPAKYFTGPSFEITKMGIIKQISPREGE